jgi:acetylornithine deacetylase/succinyl-diaminopimelate desuccinylase-like protein
MNSSEVLEYFSKEWSEGGSSLEGISDFVRVPNVTPDLDKDFFSNGLIQQAIEVVKSWILKQGIKGLTAEVIESPGISPLLYVDIPSTSTSSSSSSTSTVLSYGHLDKMPPLNPSDWATGLSPTNPVIRDGKLYGRGTADDGFQIFVVISSIRFLQERGLSHPRVVILNETAEESGKSDVEHYIERLKQQIGDPRVIFVIDSMASDDKSLWINQSCRGVVGGVLSIQHLLEPIHSGRATCVSPSTFRIARILLSRIEDEQTGEILIKLANRDIPQKNRDQLTKVGKILGEYLLTSMARVSGAKLLSDDPVEIMLNRAWKPGLAIIGADDIPGSSVAGNNIRPKTTLKLSLRVPPGIDSAEVNKQMKEILENDPPYGASVKYKIGSSGNGWVAKDMDGAVESALTESSKSIFGSEPLYSASGGSIPFTNYLQKIWPNADLILTGVDGPGSNPHGLNENLDLSYTAKFNSSFAILLNKFANL